VEEETSESQLRRCRRARKPNPKYANISLVKGPNIKEPSTHEEACQKTMEKEMQALVQNKTLELVTKPMDAKSISYK